MKPILILTTILIGIAFYGLALGKDDVEYKVIISENAITNSHSYGVKTSATVLPSPCRLCLDEPTPLEDCWARELCLDVNLAN